MQKWDSHSELQTERLGAAFAAGLKSGDVVAMFGGMGMGKTAFVRGMAAGRGLTAEVSSPTYTLVHDYGGDPPLVHCDMYRIGGIDDLHSTGFFDYLESGAILAVEWSENIEQALPEGAWRLIFTKTGENDREILLKRI
ncbi:MAG: tRNA (adenosine(37)-N6)-threonylcarbamoyltransferase complex ATPase subunit type 1 TsaE [Oscillospiraceae bacterium]|nr:tRNA (adenosine(37)-N6)-threonylcarbamoyltransferase complex ATPase subunit type 1 TsaE [Oscillospiraceae bacterium]